MEVFLVLIFLIFGWSILSWLLSAGSRTIGAAGKAAIGKGTFSDNMELAFKGMGHLEARFHDTRLHEDGTGPIVKEIEVKGLFPITESMNLGFVTSVFDETDGDIVPVISSLDTFQEEESAVYQNKTNMGDVHPNQGFIDWARVGVVIPDLLVPPYSGNRNIVAILRMVDLDHFPDIKHGLNRKNEPGIIWQRPLKFEYYFEEKGYQEASEHRDESASLALQIGVAVAMSDGILHHKEGEVLRNWIIRSIDPFTQDKQASLKKLYNQAMKDAYMQALEGNLSLSNLTQRLNDIGEKPTRYEAIELCFEVMAADGVADAEEISLIKKVAEALDLDMHEIEKMRDQKIVGLDSNVSNHASIEVLLGIEPHWTNEQIRKHLRSEFQKWNNRLNTLAEGEERENAQLMLHRISEARKKYA